MDIVQIAKDAREAGNLLQLASPEQKSLALKSIKQVLSQHKQEILDANAKDMELALKEVEAGRLSSSLYKRLDINGKNGEKFETMIKGIDEVDLLQDPTGEITLSRKLDDKLSLYRVRCPVGVILVIFEARPEVVVNIACLAIKSGNAAILKGGKEASNSNHVLAKLIKQALTNVSEECLANNRFPHEFPRNAVQLVDKREEIHDLLQLDKYIDLAIPRGSNSLVKSVQNNTRIPVLGHADGLCSIYLDESCDLEKAIHVVVDAKTDYPAACNSVETLLVHSSILESKFPFVAKALLSMNVLLHLDSASKAALKNDIQSYSNLIVDAKDEDYDHEFLGLEIAVKVVSSIDEAISHINEHGSKHTDAIITESESNAEFFMRKVDAAGVYWNASTRFADGFRYGFGAEVGVSTNKTHARGPVGLEGLTIYKYKLYGNGQGASDFGLGSEKKQYKHEDIKL
ncbi:hypothetical protein BB558_004207 [Smittium angustum]|uniref:glutamate-5-semialdehyde dehydrogenase n=1 Tax=Smittium angustum TaxID=133377 RepID=A0A2U1J406_SMIAN|nr:hypothetical protein BB558_006227 [Smittium angustum]PVZ98833.1 hypothetical protein BB558_005169 [Smittium angustum]PVZ99757.1 hypothetical protein BB558_004207 [Smittium angustum]